METFKNKLNTTTGQGIAFLVDVVLVYIFGSISVDTASMFAYAAMIFFFVTALVHLTQFTKLFWKGLAHGRSAKK